MELRPIWHQRLSHPGLKILIKTSQITEGIPNLQGLKKTNINCNTYTKSKIIRRPTKGPLTDPLQYLDSIEGNTFELKPKAHNKSSIILLLIDKKTHYQ